MGEKNGRGDNFFGFFTNLFFYSLPPLAVLLDVDREGRAEVLYIVSDCCSGDRYSGFG